VNTRVLKYLTTLVYAKAEGVGIFVYRGRSTSVQQTIASPPNLKKVLCLQKKNLIHSFVDFRFVHDNVYTDCVQHSSSSSYRIYCST